MPPESEEQRYAARKAIAERMAGEYGEVVRLALGALGPGYLPWMRLALLERIVVRKGPYWGMGRTDREACGDVDGQVRRALGLEE